MPTFKHPCPYCGKFIDKIAAACPFCGTKEPFAPKRCANCRKIIEDGWIACPSCGASLLPPAPAAPGQPQAASPIDDANAPRQPATADGATPAPAPTAAGGTPAAGPVAAAPAPVAAPAAAAPAPEAAPPVAASRCSGCGAPLSTGARFCTVCGTLAG